MSRSASMTRKLFVVGITGSMGCGKSTVTQLFAQHGARILDADAMAREVIAPATDGWREVVTTFGLEVLSGDRAEGGKLPPLESRPFDRKKLGAIVFADADKMQTLEAIIHPKIDQIRKETLQKWADQLGSAEWGVVVMEIPLLFETGLDRVCDFTLAVVCGERQWQRLQNRSGMSEATKKAAIARQLSEADKTARADRVIDNGGNLENTIEQVERLWQEIVSMAQGS